MILLLSMLGSLAMLCALFATVSAYAMGKVKGLTEGYSEGQRAGYFQGFADGLMGMQQEAKLTQNTEEVEAVL